MPPIDTGNTKIPHKRFSLFYVFIGLWLLLFAHDFLQYRKNVESVPYSQFLSYLKDGKIQEVSVGNEHIEGTLKQAAAGHPKEFTAQKMEDPGLAEKLTSAGVKFGAIRESTFLKDMASWIIPVLFLVGIWSFVFKRAGQQMGRGGGFLPIGKSRAKVYMEKDLKTRFTDVAGVDEAKEELQEVVNFLKNPTHYSKLGGRMPKGVLLVGAPGTGKTLLARAVAGEAGVPFFMINGSEFVELFVGLGAARVRDLFEQARAQAPCIVFIDELDALGKARGLNAITGSANDEKEQTLNQLLAELDGFDPSSGVVLLGATNRPEVLDPALLRAGRFDRTVLVDKPDRKGRAQILVIHMQKVTFATDVNPDALAALTAGFSGADLANLVNEAALIATRRSASAVEMRDCNEAIERVVAGLERKTRVLNPLDKKRVAYHEMGHAVVALAFGENEAVHKVSIIPRGLAALGYTLRRPIEDRYLLNRKELQQKLAVAMGGRASETAFFDDISTGAADDLDKATEIARAMITRYGMSEHMGLAVYERDSAPLLGANLPGRSFEFSELTAQRIDDEITRLLNQAMGMAMELVRRYRELVEEGAQILLNKETIDESEIKRLWEKHQSRKSLRAVSANERA